jgi:hypothetical protein
MSSLLLICDQSTTTTALSKKKRKKRNHNRKGLRPSASSRRHPTARRSASRRRTPASRPACGRAPASSAFGRAEVHACLLRRPRAPIAPHGRSLASAVSARSGAGVPQPPPAPAAPRGRAPASPSPHCRPAMACIQARWRRAKGDLDSAHKQRRSQD